MIEAEARYGVIGNPIAHSRSPEIQAAFAEQTGERIHYERVLAPLRDFVGTVERFFAAGGMGLNVTLPFKEEAFRWVEASDELAGSAGAVNIIVRSGGGLRGSNTDGIGLVRDLEGNHGFELARKRILILGAGGAVRGVLGPLLGRGPREVVISNRTDSRVDELIERFEDPRLVACRWDDRGGRFDLVINGTAAGIRGTTLDIEPARLRGAFVYDMAYGDAATIFLRRCANEAARCADGLGMLVEQAAESFFIWRGVRPDTVPVLARLRQGTS